MQQHAVTPRGSVLLDEVAIGRTLSRIAHEIIERNDELELVALVGIHARGVPLAHRLRRLVAERAGEDLALGQLDVTFHRDDVHVRRTSPPRHAPVARRSVPAPRPVMTRSPLPTTWRGAARSRAPA